MPNAKPEYKVLIVDDLANNLEILRRRLCPIGYDVYIADNGKVGLELTEKIAPDIVLLDLQMPVMDGYTYLKKLRAHPKLGATPVIAISAAIGKEDQAKLINLGFDGVFLKPIKVPTIVKILSDWLSPIEIVI